MSGARPLASCVCGDLIDGFRDTTLRLKNHEQGRGAHHECGGKEASPPDQQCGLTNVCHGDHDQGARSNKQSIVVAKHSGDDRTTAVRTRSRTAAVSA